VAAVYLSYLEAGNFTNARYLVRRLRRKLPNVQIIVGFWGLSEDEAKRINAQRETGADLVVTSLREAVEQITTAAKSPLTQVTSGLEPHRYTSADAVKAG
jgi:inosine-uridine nucleoside N-ribohydrolase